MRSCLAVVENLCGAKLVETDRCVVKLNESLMYADLGGFGFVRVLFIVH